MTVAPSRVTAELPITAKSPTELVMLALGRVASPSLAADTDPARPVISADGRVASPFPVPNAVTVPAELAVVAFAKVAPVLSAAALIVPADDEVLTPSNSTVGWITLSNPRAVIVADMPVSVVTASPVVAATIVPAADEVAALSSGASTLPSTIAAIDPALAVKLLGDNPCSTYILERSPAALEAGAPQLAGQLVDDLQVAFQRVRLGAARALVDEAECAGHAAVGQHRR